jgi:hypothetical protein
MKTSKLRKATRTEIIYACFSDPTVNRAITRFSSVFRILNRKTTTLRYRQELMAERLVLMALAHIEVIAPRFQSMINYCAAEDLDQFDYLRSLIRTKFQKKLHLVKNDEEDDDDDDGGSRLPVPSLPRRGAG